MKIPFSWLQEYFPTPLSPQKCADALTLGGLEVEHLSENGILEIAITPNLAHCISVRGVARELSALLQIPWKQPKFSSPPKSNGSIQGALSVQIENKEAAPRYSCCVIKGVSAAPSPQWLRERIEACGIRSVNNVVDVTNYVMLELGQPLHAYDLATLHGNRIVLRDAKKGEKVTTLDGVAHDLSENLLLICDKNGAIAVAGIIGAQHTEVSDKTKDIVLEAAYFEPKAIRRARKELEIQTEASYRFERGVDPNGLLEALERAAALICEIAKGNYGGALDVKTKEFLPLNLSCRLSRANRVLGTQLALGEVETIFHRLEFDITKVQEDLIEVSTPTYRHDLHQEIDLIEEIARIYGYGHIHAKESPLFRTGELAHAPMYLFECSLREHLVGSGLQEFVTCDLISPNEAELVAHDGMAPRALIKILNPSSLEYSILRPSLLPGLLKVVKFNANHDLFSISGFEIGRLHFKAKETYLEPTVLSILLADKDEAVDFLDLKGVLENLFRRFKITSPRFVKSNYDTLHPGRQAAVIIEGVEIGSIGEIHPATLLKMDLSQRVLFAELNLDEIKRFIKQEIQMKPLPNFPSSKWDWTVAMETSQPVQQIFDLLEKIESPLLESVSFIDVYKSESLGLNKKNVTFRFVYRDPEKTISFDEAKEEHRKITERIIENL